nr:metal tolerance protein 9 [Quercus suber]
MEEGGNNMEVTRESRRENFVPQDIESATRSDMSSGSWRLSVPEFPTLVERRDGGERRDGSSMLKSFPRYTEMETMAENGYMPGNLTEDELQQLAKNERMAIHVSNMANVVLFAAKLYVSIQSRSLAVIASTLDSLLDLLSGFILWFTAHAMRNPNQYRYPIGKNRMQPVVSHPIE